MDEAAFPNALPAGTRVGPVVLDHAIGQGAWGIVYDGQHDTWGHVAVKEYFPSTYASRQTRGSVGGSAPQWQEAVRRGLERFAQEGRALKSIRHENVVPVYEFLESDGAALLVMDFVEGRTLSDAFAAGQFHDPAAVMALGTTLVDTLQAIHAKNVLHRDIAPDNIMIRPDGSPVLIDFGGAAAAIASATRSTQNVVKDGYSPPEQYDTSANPTFPIGPWSDIYATAAVLYRLAAAREPAVSNARLLAAGSRTGADPLVPLSSLAPAGYPKNWLAAVDSGLALLPKDRPQTANEWRKRFETAPVAARRMSPLLVGGAVAALVAAASAAVFVGPRLMNRPAPVVAQATPAPSPTAMPAKHPSRATPHVVKHAVVRPAAPTPQIIVQQVQVPVQQVAAQPAPAQAAPQHVVAAAVKKAPAKAAGNGVSVTLTANPPSVEAGTPVRLCASAKNAARIEVRSAEGVLGEGAGCRTITPSATGNYTAVAFAAGGATASSSAHVVVHEVVVVATPVPVATPTPTPKVTPTPKAVVLTPVPTPTPPKIIVIGACASGFVWRVTIPSDHVCVTPAERNIAAVQNALAASRRDPAGPYGPNSCKAGFVWREAYSGDAVCVTPPERTAAKAENSLGPSRTAH